MKKTSLTERFQELAGLKPLAEQPKFPYGQDLGSMQANPDLKFSDPDFNFTDVNPYATGKDDRKIFTPADRLKNSSILSQINTGAKWAEVMDVLIKRADDIGGLSDSAKRIYLQNALKAI